jgi:tetratricopeptide (TPR) repeat protein
MLFIPDSLHEERLRVLQDCEQGRIPALAAAERLLELEPTDWLALRWLGQLKRDEGDLAAAEAYFTRAIEANPWD